LKKIGCLIAQIGIFEENGTMDEYLTESLESMEKQRAKTSKISIGLINV